MASNLAMVPKHRKLEADFIADTLSIYAPENIAIVAAVSTELATEAVIRPSPYPFTKPGHINYLTASMAALYVSQAGYLHIRCAVESQITPLFDGISDESFCESRDRGDIIFSELKMRFRRKISLSTLLTLRFSHLMGRRTRAGIIGRFACVSAGQELEVAGTSMLLFQ